jgi:hypothetical protein
MEGFVELGQRLLAAVVRLFLNPLYYAGIILVILQYRRQIKLERKLFSTRLHSLIGETWRAALWGLAGGVSASVLMAVVGASVQPEAVWLLWGAALVLMLFRVRYMCLAYSVGIVGMASALADLAPHVSDADSVPWQLLRMLQQIDVPTLLAMVGVLHMVEALLIRTQGTRMAMPMFYQGKRGKIIGGYQLQGFWPAPLFLIVPMAGGSDVSLPWTTLLSGGLWNSGWTVLSLPVMIGFAELTLLGAPKAKARLSSGWLAAYGVLVLLLAVAVRYWPPLAFISALLCILLHETLIWYSQWVEEGRSPYFVHDERGLRVLAVLPNSAAEELGIVPGEIVHKVNGMQVRRREDLHQALRLNSAFSKLEILNLQGEVKFASRPLYANEHHQLGLILAPDEEAQYYMEARQPSLLGYLSRGLTGLANKPRPRSPEPPASSGTTKDLS